ncbi:MAG: c-type cytochrome [Chitinophagales bacterium]
MIVQKRRVIIALIGIILFPGCSGGIATETMESGQKVYQTYCQSCHMESGGGVPNMNASLIGSKYIAGDKNKLISIVLHGSAEFANEHERRYQNLMPPLPNLSDKEIADVLTFTRNSFTNKASAVGPEEVKHVRELK